MDFKSMTVRDFFEVNGGKELCEKYAPNLLKYPIKIMNKKKCGEIFDKVVAAGIVPENIAKQAEAKINEILAK